MAGFHLREYQVDQQMKQSKILEKPIFLFPDILQEPSHTISIEIGLLQAAPPIQEH